MDEQLDPPPIPPRARSDSYRWLALVAALAVITALCFWLWRVESLRPWIVSIGAALVAFLGPIPGLLSEKGRNKWLMLVGVAALIGVGTWVASKQEEKQKEEARFDAAFLRTMLVPLSPEMQSELCKGVARRLQTLTHERRYEDVKRGSAILHALRPTNGHALYFAGEAARGLSEYGEMLTGFREYLHYADTEYMSEAFDGPQEKCYDRASGYCAERTAWIENLLANYFFEKAQHGTRSERIASLRQVVTETEYMLKSRAVGFNSDSSVHDSVDLLRQTAAQLNGLEQSPADALALLARLEGERRRVRGGGTDSQGGGPS